MLLLRDMAASGIFQAMSGSKKRGNSWQNIATNINAYYDFIITIHAVRDQLTNIMRKYKSHARKEIAGTGLGGEEFNQYEQLLEDLIERYKEGERRTEKSSSDKRVQGQEDKKKPMDMRKKAMKTYGKNRNGKDLEGEGDSSKERKSRRTSFDMMTFLHEKMDQNSEMKKEELEAKEGDKEARENERPDTLKQNQALQMQHKLKQNQALQTQQSQLSSVIIVYGLFIIKRVNVVFVCTLQIQLSYR